MGIKLLVKIIAIIGLPVVLFGCGGEESTVAAANQLPVANAGPDQTVDEQTLVNLSGSGSDADGSIASYNWNQLSGSPVILANPASASSSFISPDVTIDETIRFELVVADNDGASSRDIVNINIKHINQLPVVSAGTDQAVKRQTLVYLIASATDADGSIVQYQWLQIGGPALTLNNENSLAANFIAPNTPGLTLSFELTVIDNNGASASDRVDIRTTTSINLLPEANAGLDQIVNELMPVNLNGSGTDTDGTIARYSWTQLSGTNVTLNNETSPSTSFTAPDITGNETLSFRLTVTDNEGANASDNVDIALIRVIVMPIANAGLDQAVNEQTLVNLSGSGTDADGTIASYSWTQLSGTGVVLTNATTAGASFIAPDLSADETLSFQLAVTDNDGAVATDNVDILVTRVIIAPIANAGLDQTVNEQTLVNLNGSGTDADGAIASYSWIQLSGTSVTLNNANTASASFIAPDITVDEILSFQLAVTDNDGAVATDVVDISMTRVIIAPIANAGLDQTVNEQTLVNLNGSGTDADGSIASYSWIQLSGTSITLNNANTAGASFTAPDISADETLSFRLTVTDNDGELATDTVDIAVTTNIIILPVANAGPDQTVNEQTLVNLSGSGTDADGTIVSYSWTQLSGTSVVLTNATTAGASFTAPDLNADETLSFQLAVTDNDGALATDNVDILVTRVIIAPTANAGLDQIVNEQTLVNLDGSGADADGTISTYSWTQISGTSVLLTNANLATASFIAPDISADEILSFELTVTDNDGATGTDVVDISVTRVIVVPVANAGPAQTVNEQTLVNLDGSGADADGIISTYSWTQISGASVLLTNANLATASFIAPDISADEILSFELTVTDNDGATGTDVVDISVTRVIVVPVANAGPAQTVNEQTLVNLSGSGTDADGTIASYSWAQLSGTTVILTNSNTANASFTVPDISADETLSFRLTVTDNDAATGVDVVDISVTRVIVVPIANAGPDQVVNEQTLVNLGGSGTDTDGSIVSYSWVQLSGTSVTLSNAVSASTSFTAPAINVDETLSFQLTVMDNDGATANDTVTIQVNRVNQLPQANAGPDQIANEQTLVSLNGSGTDVDGLIMSYSWTQISGTSVTLMNANAAVMSFTAPDIGADEILGFQLTVTDNDGAIATDTASINLLSLWSIGGSVSGLTGTLEILNNGGDIVSITNNGVYAFPGQLNNGNLYNVTVSQNPAAQICSISNDNGLVNGANIDNVDITCSASGVLVTLSGSYQAAPLIQVDSDINDPLAEANVDNNTLVTSQPIPNFSRVHGFVSFAGTGRTGDRFESTADTIDQYNVVLQSGQILSLQIADFTAGGVFQGDLDMLLMDSSGNMAAASTTTNALETIVVPADGMYNIVVQAVSGSSKYTLSLDSVPASGAVALQSLDFVPGEVIIQFKPSASVAGLSAKSNQTMKLSHGDASRAAKAKFNVSASSGLISQRLQKPGFEQNLAQNNPESYEKLKTLQEIKRLSLREDVEYAEPNYIYHAQRVPNDTFYSRQWHYPAVNLPQAWDITTGTRAGSDVIVAVVDSGILVSHPEFVGQLVDGYDFIASSFTSKDGDGIDPDPDDPGDGTQLSNSTWHGTHVAGTVAALSNNNSGVAGVAWDAKIMPVRVLGLFGGTNYDIMQGVRFAAGLINDSGTVPTQRADVINLSLAGGGFSQSAQDIFNQVRALGVIVVAAAGNGNTSQLWYPASYDGVVSVSATDFGSNRAPYSNTGSRIDVAAPGGNLGADLNNDTHPDGVFSTLVDTSSGSRLPTHNYSHGTSMASPHVAGIIALMRAVYPALTPDQFDTLLSSGAITTDLGAPGRDSLFGYGLIDALKAVQQAQLLANGGDPNQTPALIVASPNQFTMGLSDSASLVLSNQGGQSTSVTGTSSDASWLSIAGVSLDVNGLGEYQIQINRAGLIDSTYVGNITFNLATGNSVQVQVSMMVGASSGSSNIGKIYLRLLDANNNNTVVDQVNAIDQGNGVFDYSFSNVSAGSYRIIGGSDIDNDATLCQTGEVCGGYPIFNALDVIPVTNSNITDLDFIMLIKTD